jgi:hypothetical protein
MFIILIAESGDKVASGLSYAAVTVAIVHLFICGVVLTIVISSEIKEGRFKACRVSLAFCPCAN